MYRPELDNNKDKFYKEANPDDWAFFTNEPYLGKSDMLMRIRLPFDMGPKRQYGRGYQELHIDPERPLQKLHLIRYYTWDGNREHPSIEETVHYSQWEGYIIEGVIVDADSNLDPWQDLPYDQRPKYYGRPINGASSYLRRIGKALSWHDHNKHP